MSRKHWFTVFFAFVAFCFLVGCASAPAPTVQAPAPTALASVPTVKANPTSVPAPSPKVLVIAQGTDITQLDPHNSSALVDVDAMDQIYESLVRRNSQTMDLEPLLALSWKAMDGVTWQFKLRQGVKFTNGEPFNAEAVKYNLERVLNPDNKLAMRSQFETIDRVSVLDADTVNVTTKGGDPLLPARFSTFGGGMVPPEHTKKVGSAGLTKDPIGTGPYKFVSWVKDDQLTLEANNEYWGGKPSISKVIIKPIPESAARVAALLKGEVDIALNVPPDDAASIDKSGKARVVTRPSYLRANLCVDVTSPPLDNRLVRQALSFAIDRDKIVKNLLLGYGEALRGGIMPTEFGYDASKETIKYDPDKAKALLKAAGYAGQTVKLQGTQGSYIKDKEIAESIQGSLQAVGMKAELAVTEFSVFMETLNHKRPLAGIQLCWNQSPLFDPDGVWRRLLAPGAYYNYGWSNPEFEQQMKRAQSIVDPAERKSIYNKMIYGVAQDEAVFIPLLLAAEVHGVGPKVKNFLPRTDLKKYVMEIQMN